MEAIYPVQNKKCSCSRHDILTHAGRTMSVSQWAEDLGCSTAAMAHRVRAFGLDDPRTFMHSEELKEAQRVVLHRANRKKNGNAEWRQLGNTPRPAAG